ncbi:MAG: bacteriohemerythrin [SAR324 cluster bacterium]|nr:bacteriohemerythrin [SAR324 cluster bacterium]
MNFLKNLSIAKKNLIFAVIPLIGFSYFVLSLVTVKNTIKEEMIALEQLTTLGVASSAVVHQLQIERGMSAGFLGTKGLKFTKELKAQRGNTVKAQKELKRVLTVSNTSNFSTGIKANLKEVKSQIAKKESIQKRIDSFSISTPEAIGYYSNLNSALLENISLIAGSSSNGLISARLIAFSNFVQGKEKAGIERAVLTNVFAQDSFSPGTFEKWKELVLAQKFFNNIFIKFTSEDQIRLLKAQEQLPPFKKTQEMQQIAEAKGLTGNFNITSSDWFTSQTAKIDLLKQVEDATVKEILALTRALRSEAEASLKQTLVVAFFLGLLILLIAITFSLDQAKSIAKLVEDIKKCASGRQDIEIDLDRTDEIGQISSALAVFIAHLQAKNVIADQVAEGDLTVVVPLVSEYDTMGLSLTRMVYELKLIINQVQEKVKQLTSSSKDLSFTSNQMSNSTREMSDQSSNISNAAVEMSQSIDAVASATHQLSTNIGTISGSAGQMSDSFGNVEQAIKEINASTHEVSQLAKDAVEVAESAQSVSVSATETMTQLGSSANEIGDVTIMIKKIAEQTNLLALNANIEAASAGDAGKGFAVVANEIKELAKQSSKAAEDIAIKISGIQGQAKKSVEAIFDIDKVIRQVSESSNNINLKSHAQEQASKTANGAIESGNFAVKAVTSLIEEMAAATEEVSRSSSEMAQGAAEVSKSIVRIAAATKNSAADSKGVNESATLISVVAERLLRSVQDFKIREGQNMVQDKVKFMTWTEELSVNIKEMDDQHINLVAHINDVHESIVEEDPRQGMIKKMDALIDYCKFHFKEEETALEAKKYPNIATQKRQHKIYIQQLEDYKNILDPENLSELISVISALQTWILEHILVHDKGYSAHMNQAGVQ